MLGASLQRKITGKGRRSEKMLKFPIIFFYLSLFSKQAAFFRNAPSLHPNVYIS